MRRHAWAALSIAAGLLAPVGAQAMIDPIAKEPVVVRTSVPASGPYSATSYSAPGYGTTLRSRGSIAREVVDFPSKEAPGTVIISTDERRLYLVIGAGKALRYGIGVGRDGFQWGGTHQVTQKREWPDWRPPAEMLGRQPFLPNFMPGGPNNPLGARAMYLGSTLYRIHGSNEPHTIGAAVSSGCFRMTNEDVIDLYERVKVGAKVVVMR